MKRDIRLEVVYPHAPERVWRALTGSAVMADWLMPNNFAPRLGHRFQFRTKPAPGFSGIVDCEVIELMASKTLAFTWKGGGMDTVVRFTFEPVLEGTRLRFEHTGFRGVARPHGQFHSGQRVEEQDFDAAFARVRGARGGYGYRPLALDGLERKCG